MLNEKQIAANIKARILGEKATKTPSAYDNTFELPTFKPTERYNKETKMNEVMPANPNPDNYLNWMPNTQFMEYNPEDAHCVIVVKKEDIPSGCTIIKANRGSGTLQPKGTSNIYAEIIATFSDREKVAKWAADLVTKPENYLTSKDQDFIASNIPWDYKRLLKLLPAGTVSDDERTIFNVKDDRLKVLLYAAKKEQTMTKRVENMPETTEYGSKPVPNDEYTVDSIPF